jgi:hypothetical protein
MSKTKPYDADNYGWNEFTKAVNETDPELLAMHEAEWKLWKAGYITGFASGMLYKPGDEILGDEVEEEKSHEPYLSEKDKKEQEHPFMHFMRSFLKR